MKKTIWALICGQLRNEFEFLTTLCCVCELRKQNIISGIVLSTWYGEVERIDGLRDKLRDLDVSVIENEQIISAEYADIGYLRQATQVKSGLNLIPAGEIVLKCRTDFSNFDINRMDILFNKRELRKARKWGDFNPGFEYLVEVLRIGVSTPFAFHDICFLGSCEDLAQMINIDNCKINIGETIIPDIYFFLGCFINRYSIIEDFFRYISIEKFGFFMKRLRVHEEDFELPNALNKFYAIYFVIVYCCFSICHEYKLDETNLELKDIFYDTERTKKAVNNGPFTIEIRNQRIVDQLVNGGFRQTKGYNKLLNEINRIKACGYTEKLRFSKDDYIELELWGEKYFGVSASEWLKPFIKFKKNNNNNIGFQESATLLFSEYNMNDNAYNALKDISFNKESYYNSVIKYLNVFDETDYRLYKKALFCSMRYLNEDVLYKVCQLLLDNNLNDEEQKEAVYVFERYQHDARIYSLPMTKKKLKAICMFIRYQYSKSSKSNAATELCIRLQKYFEISSDYSIDYSLMDLINLFKTICNNEYKDERLEMQLIIKSILEDFLLV